MECSATFLRSVFKKSGSVSKLIVLNIIRKKVIAVSLLKCYEIVRKPNNRENQKQKLDSNDGNDVVEISIYQRQKFGT